MDGWLWTRTGTCMHGNDYVNKRDGTLHATEAETEAEVDAAETNRVEHQDRGRGT